MRSVTLCIGMFFVLVSTLLISASGRVHADSSSTGSIAEAVTATPVTLVEEGPMNCEIKTTPGQPVIYLKGTFHHVFGLTISKKRLVTGTGEGKFNYISDISGLVIKASGVSQITVSGNLENDSEGAPTQLIVQSRNAKQIKHTIEYHLKVPGKSDTTLMNRCVYDADAESIQCDRPGFPFIEKSKGNAPKMDLMKEWTAPGISLPFKNGARTNWDYYEPKSGCTVKGTSTLLFGTGK